MRVGIHAFHNLLVAVVNGFAQLVAQDFGDSARITCIGERSSCARLARASMCNPCSHGTACIRERIPSLAAGSKVAMRARPRFDRFDNCLSLTQDGFAWPRILCASYASQLLSTLKQTSGKVNRKIT